MVKERWALSAEPILGGGGGGGGGLWAKKYGT